MIRSTFLTPGPLRAAIVRAGLLAIVLAAPALAQRVQFPTPAEPVPAPSPYAAPGSPPQTYSPPSATPVYPTTPYAPSPYAMPANPAPAPYNPPAVGPPPPFDPYSSGATVGPPPPALPYNYTPPPPASSFPTQPGALFPEGSPFQWQPGSGDLVTGAESYWATTTRLLQELRAEHTWLYGDHEKPRHLEIHRLELCSTFAIPMFYNIETPLLVTPGFAFNWLAGPATEPFDPGPPPMGGGPDLPPRVYDAYLDFAWYPRMGEWLGAELGFRTGVWSDLGHTTSDSIRLLGRGLASVALTPHFDVLFGAVYLDRLHVKLLPAGGFYYRPTPEWDMYVVFPNPKIRRFIAAIGNTKWFWYGAGEYGGGSWTVRRETTSDRIDINDIRVIAGLEWETQTFVRGHIEAGYVWDREIRFASGDPTDRFKLNDTVMLRAGISF